MTEDKQAASPRKIIIDRDLCCGYGVCKEICPQVFELDDAGIVVLLTETIPEGLEEETVEAAEACPQMAITFA